MIDFRKHWDIMLMATVFSLLVLALVSWLALSRGLQCGPVSTGVAQCEKITSVYGLVLSRQPYADVASASIQEFSRNHNPTTRMVLQGSAGAQPFTSGFASGQRQRQAMVEAINRHLQSGSADTLKVADRTGWPAAAVTAIAYLATLVNFWRRSRRKKSG